MYWIPFPIMRGGNLPEAWILSYTGRPTKKTHGGRVPSGRPVDFGSTLGSRLTGQVRPSTHMDGYRVNQELQDRPKLFSGRICDIRVRYHNIVGSCLADVDVSRINSAVAAAYQEVVRVAPADTKTIASSRKDHIV